MGSEPQVTIQDRFRDATPSEMAEGYGKMLMKLSMKLYMDQDKEGKWVKRAKFDMQRVRETLRDITYSCWMLDRGFSLEEDSLNDIHQYDTLEGRLQCATSKEIDEHPVFKDIIDRFASVWGWNPNSYIPERYKPKPSPDEKKAEWRKWRKHNKRVKAMEREAEVIRLHYYNWTAREFRQMDLDGERFNSLLLPHPSRASSPIF